MLSLNSKGMRVSWLIISWLTIFWLIISWLTIFWLIISWCTIFLTHLPSLSTMILNTHTRVCMCFRWALFFMERKGWATLENSSGRQDILSLKETPGTASQWRKKIIFSHPFYCLILTSTFIVYFLPLSFTFYSFTFYHCLLPLPCIFAFYFYRYPLPFTFTFDTLTFKVARESGSSLQDTDLAQQRRGGSELVPEPSHRAGRQCRTDVFLQLWEMVRGRTRRRQSGERIHRTRLGSRV